MPDMQEETIEGNNRILAIIGYEYKVKKIK